jgi:protoporphyrinogen oxidase
MRVAVLGAGPAGLAAAREFCAHGVDVVALERAPWVGGLAMTWVHDGFRFDLGGHRWFTKNDWLHAWFLELMRDELVMVKRRSRIYSDGGYFDYPVRIANVLRTAGVATSLQAMLSYLVLQARVSFRARPIETVEDALVAQFGPKLYRMFFKDYTEKVWGSSCSELSADWVSQRTKGLSIWNTVRDAIAKPSREVESLVHQFAYPRLGFQRISDRMREDIADHGGRVLLESTVTGVSMRPDRVVVRYRAADGSRREIEADHVVSTIPLGRLVTILQPRPRADVLDAAKRLTFRSLITANLLLDRQRVTDDTWIYVQEPGIGFARIHEPRNWSPAMAPSGKTSLCAEWFCTSGDETWALSDGEIVERTVKHLVDDLGFIERGEVIDGFVLRARNAYPVYTLDYDRHSDTLKSHLSHYEKQISIAGRGGTFRYNNTDHSIETGLLAARNLLGEEHDVEAVNTEAEYHEEKRG